jgi:2'-5' RNA ligase
MIFPGFENIEIINKIRDRYDPLSKLIRPHITLVFPFESDISNSELNAHMRTALSGCKPFDLEMRGFSASVEPWSNYIFLNVTAGLQNLFELSKNLYTGILDKFKPDYYKDRYCPHLTVGNLDKMADYKAILKNLENENAQFITRVDRVNAEIIGDDNSSKNEMTISL